MTTRERGSASGISPPPRRCRSAFPSGLAAGLPCRVAASLTAQQPEKPGEGLTRLGHLRPRRPWDPITTTLNPRAVAFGTSAA